MKVFKYHKFITEQHIRQALLTRPSEGDRQQFIEIELGLRSKLYHLILQSFFKTFWQRMVNEGKDDHDYVYDDDAADQHVWTDKPDASSSTMVAELAVSEEEVAVVMASDDV